VWLEPQLVTGPIDSFTAFITPFLDKVPALIARLTVYGQTHDFGQLANFGKDLTGVFISAISSSLGELHLPRIILALVLWAVLGNLLNFVLQNQVSTITGLLAKMERIPHTTRIHGALFVILAFGCFLSIAAIVAVPYLRQSAEASEAELAQLERRLNDSAIPDEVYKTRFPSELPEPEAFSKLRETVRTLLGSSDSTERKSGSDGNWQYLGCDLWRSEHSDRKLWRVSLRRPTATNIPKKHSNADFFS